MKSLHAILALLALDAAEGGSPDGAEEDPLAADVSGIDTTFPKLQAGLYDVEITDAEVGPGKTNVNSENMKLTMKTTQDATDTQGNHVNKGFPLYDYIALTPTQGGNGKQPYTGKDIAKKIATVAKVCGLSGITPRQIIDAKGEPFKGKVVRVKVKISKETTEFPESNKVAQYVPVE